ncbi:C69 family dipeptidase, partial [Paenibacillus polymyxa]|nr:C69 family dipeptidase [Paenibacillus polymyxa]
NMPKAHAAIHWLAEGVNIFNSPVPFFANCTTTPENFQYTPTDKSSTDSFYWLNKLIAMVADPLFAEHNWDAEVAVSESRKFGFAAGRAAV